MRRTVVLVAGVGMDGCAEVPQKGIIRGDAGLKRDGRIRYSCVQEMTPGTASKTSITVTGKKGSPALEQQEDDQPEAYERLEVEEQIVLQYWIRQTMIRANVYDKRNSRQLKHDFEQEGFVVSNGAFKGAMRAAGYHPRDPHACLWTFKVRPRMVVQDRKGEHFFSSSTYLIGRFDQVYGDLLHQAKKVQRRKINNPCW